MCYEKQHRYNSYINVGAQGPRGEKVANKFGLQWKEGAAILAKVLSTNKIGTLREALFYHGDRPSVGSIFISVGGYLTPLSKSSTSNGDFSSF